MIDDFFTQTAVVQQATKTRTGMGGSTSSWSTRIAALNCRLARKLVGFGEVDEYGKKVLTTALRLYCAATATTEAISSDDRIVISGSTYEIKGRSYNPGGLNRHLELELMEVE